jgi:hypothetical protein
MNTTTRNLRGLAESIEDVLAITCYGRSGSHFFQGLFDDHPNVITTPGIVLARVYRFHAMHAHLSGRELIDAFVSHFAVLFDAGSDTDEGSGQVMGFLNMGPEQNQSLGIDRTIFIASMNEIFGEEPTVSSKLFFQAIHVAYQEALTKPLGVENIRIVFPIHYSSPLPTSDHFSLDFPRAKYICMIREPVQTLASWFKYYPVGSIAGISTILMDGVPINEECRSRSRAVRLEDLNRKPEIVMKKVCQWLNLPWHDSLLTSTFQGLKWWGFRNSTPISGFSEKAISQSHDDVVPSFDRMRLQVLLARKCSVWNYDVPARCHSVVARLVILPLLLLPLRLEWPAVSALRRQMLSELSAIPRKGKQQFVVPLKRAAWFVGIGNVVLWFRIRNYLFRGWARLFSEKSAEIELL